MLLCASNIVPERARNECPDKGMFLHGEGGQVAQSRARCRVLLVAGRICLVTSTAGLGIGRRTGTREGKTAGGIGVAVCRR